MIILWLIDLSFISQLKSKLKLTFRTINDNIDRCLKLLSHDAIFGMKLYSIYIKNQFTFIKIILCDQSNQIEIQLIIKLCPNSNRLTDDIYDIAFEWSKKASNDFDVFYYTLYKTIYKLLLKNTNITFLTK